MSKTDYLSVLLKGRIYDGMLMNAALIYWHSGIPLVDAVMYMDHLYKKLNREPANT